MKTEPSNLEAFLAEPRSGNTKWRAYSKYFFQKTPKQAKKVRKMVGMAGFEPAPPDPQFERLPSGYVHHGLLLRDSTIHIPVWSAVSTGVHSVSCHLSCQFLAGGSTETGVSAGARRPTLRQGGRFNAEGTQLEPAIRKRYRMRKSIKCHVPEPLTRHLPPH